MIWFVCHAVCLHDLFNPHPPFPSTLCWPLIYWVSTLRAHILRWSLIYWASTLQACILCCDEFTRTSMESQNHSPFFWFSQNGSLHHGPSSAAFGFSASISQLITSYHVTRLPPAHPVNWSQDPLPPSPSHLPLCLYPVSRVPTSMAQVHANTLIPSFLLIPTLNLPLFLLGPNYTGFTPEQRQQIIKLSLVSSHTG